MKGKSGLLVFVLSLLFPLVASAHQFTWDNLMYAAVKLQPNFDYEGHVDSYMQIFRPEIWQKYSNDEFEIHDKEKQTLKMMKKRISSFNLKEGFTVNTAFNFGDYDFSGHDFPLNAISQNTYFYKTNYGSVDFPTTYRVFFVNANKVGNIKMSEAKAKKFLESRKSQYGGVNRQVPAKLQFKIVGVKDDGHDLKAKLTKVTIYSDNQMRSILAQF